MTIPISRLLTTTTLACVCALQVGGVAQAAMFEDVAANAGITYVGESWGGAWGDFNGDGLPDLWASNHGRLPSLYLNQGDGSFTEIAESVIPADVWNYYSTTLGGYDAHGASWVDIDRDGDLDLLQAADGNSRNHPNHLFLNEGGVSFSAEIGAAAGVDSPTSTTRKPLILDWNGDGYADIFMTVAGTAMPGKPLAFFESSATLPGAAFDDMTLIFPVTSNNSTTFGTLADLDGDRLLEIVVGPTPNFVSVLEFTAGEPANVTAALGLQVENGAVDGVVADFDGDLDLDIFAVRGEFGREIVQIDPLTLELTLAPKTTEESISFVSTGDVTVSIYPAFQLSNNDIYIGASGYHPEELIVAQGRQMTLSSAESQNHGIAAHTPGMDKGQYIGFEPATSTWTIAVSTPSSVSRNIVVTSTATISDLTAAGFNPAASARDDLYYRNDPGGFVSAGAAAGFTVSSSARSVATADFDNDGDMDIFAVATGAVQNRANVLWLNDGAGNFTPAVDHGAEGTSAGRGDGAAVADYDGDGFVDVFVTNGKSKAPYHLDGPYFLFRNLGNANHWIELDLVGSSSEIQGIGATITVTTGATTQRRIHGNGNNFRNQHMLRTHFGLGTASLIDEIHIAWPSGTEQTLQNVAIDQILTITEPGDGLDIDGDGVFDNLDNCSQAANAGQEDADGDGFGNVCDADFNNDCTIDFLDLGLLKAVFFGTDAVFDLNSDGAVDFLDLGMVKESFFGAPGPSGTSSLCSNP